MFEKLPLKGPILVYGVVALGLVGAARWASHLAQRFAALEQAAAGVPTAGQVDGALDGAPPSATPDLEALGLGAFAPLAGIDPEALRAPAPAEPATEPTRPPGWTYPAFDAPGDANGRHGPPPRATPRNVSLVLRDPGGMPLVVASLEVEQGGDDGTSAPNAYCFGDDSARWTIGSRGITTDSAVSFLVRARIDDMEWHGVAGMPRVPADVDLELGDVVLVPVAPAAPRAPSGSDEEPE